VRPRPADASSGYLFLGKVYASEAEYLAARRVWRERRERLIARIEAQDLLSAADEESL
jgi:hypothetical protein